MSYLLREVGFISYQKLRLIGNIFIQYFNIELNVDRTGVRIILDVLPSLPFCKLEISGLQKSEHFFRPISLSLADLILIKLHTETATKKLFQHYFFLFYSAKTLVYFTVE